MDQIEQQNILIVELSAIIGVCVYLAKLLNLGTVVSVLFAMSIVCILVNYCLILLRRKRMKLEDMLLLVFALVAILLADWEMSFDFIKPTIIVLCCVLCIDLSTCICLSYKQKRNILVLVELAVLVTNVMYYLGGLRNETYGSTSAIALNFTNPNETAMWLVTIIFILLSGASGQKSKIHRVFLLCSAISLIPILYATQSRACIVSLALFLVLGIVRAIKKREKFSSAFLTIVVLSPAIIYAAYQYIFMPFYEVISGWFAFLALGGKDLSSRAEIWDIVQAHFWKCFLFGEYHVFYTEQMHNALATLFCRFGLLFTVIVCCKFYKAIKKASTGRAQLAMCAAWVIGCFETGFFAGTGGIYLLLMILPMVGEKNRAAFVDDRK